MKYQHRFEVNASLNQVADFHTQSASMGAITPPPVMVRVSHAPHRLQAGDEMDFVMWLGPWPIRWLARIENSSPTGFSDRQLRGPFQSWLHRHTFEQVDETTTAVIDEIEAELQRHLWWRLAGLGMWLGLPFLFAYRGWKTRRLLNPKNLN